ncbi:putative ca2+ calmodulin-dependent protein kinase [Phaeomoniella chlamydospora]|uniref:non-specific serine/threonine protein kinase n=1 Tax=Phaeomoniella chlamydospora TaxID=158046 RepID=A0A0G2GGM7_PHACM|nr:putative ca2+ calmodulin-dependent protein kinase [Phaeomoniella chlamydospora]
MALDPLNIDEIDKAWLPDQLIDVREGEQCWWQDETQSAFTRNLEVWYGREWSEVLNAGIGIRDPKHEWRGVRPLGQGGYGWAALYERREVGTGRVLEQAVLKETGRTNTSCPNYWTKNKTVPTEANIMAQTNSKNNQNIVQLKSFKRYLNWKGNPKYRFFLEYCPHGDLKTLRYRYRMFGEFLPESFIWHVFHSLARVAVTFKEEEWSTTSEENKESTPEENEVVHFDLKCENIFLGEPDLETGSDASAPLRAFPSIKLGDFGMAQVTSREDPWNPQLHWGGTQAKMPPEQDHLNGSYLRRWWPRTTKKPWKKTFRKFDEKHNIWCIGAVCYELLYVLPFDLASAYNQGKKLYKDQHVVDEIHTARGNPDKPGRKAKGSRDEEYSLALRELIRQCIHPDPEKRPTARQLFERTEKRMHDHLNETRKKVRRHANGPLEGQAYNKRSDPHSLYFRGNEINEMAPGTLAYPILNYKDEAKVGRQGWIENMHQWDPTEPDPEPRRVSHRGIPGAPIIYPKLRWYPENQDFWLLKKRQKLATRSRSSARPNIMEEVYIDIKCPDGSTLTTWRDRDKVVNGTLSYDDSNREKDVWVGSNPEYGSLNDELRETADASHIHSFITHRERGYSLPGRGTADFHVFETKPEMATYARRLFGKKFPTGFDEIPTGDAGYLCGLKAIIQTMQHMDIDFDPPTISEFQEIMETRDWRARIGLPVYHDVSGGITEQQMASILRIWGERRHQHITLGVLKIRRDSYIPFILYPPIGRDVQDERENEFEEEEEEEDLEDASHESTSPEAPLKLALAKQWDDKSKRGKDTTIYVWILERHRFWLDRENSSFEVYNGMRPAASPTPSDDDEFLNNFYASSPGNEDEEEEPEANQPAAPRQPPKPPAYQKGQHRGRAPLPPQQGPRRPARARAPIHDSPSPSYSPISRNKAPSLKRGRAPEPPGLTTVQRAARAITDALGNVIETVTGRARNIEAVGAQEEEQEGRRESKRQRLA